jgi:putative transposase
MANTYTQIHIQAIFAVQNRISLIKNEWKHQMYQYIIGILNKYGHKTLAINGMPDHVHLFFGMRPTQSLSDLMQDIKGGSSKWINDNKLVNGKFQWQEGYGGFSYSRSHIDRVAKYIRDQEIHHRKKTFLTEYKEFLKKFEVEHDETYLFKEIEG